MLGINLSNVESASGYDRPGAGGYVIQITKATPNTEKHRVEMEFDIVEGKYSGYFKEMQERLGWHNAKFNKPYTPKALPFFRGFIEAILESNGNTEGLVIGDFEDVDETKLVGKRLGMIVGEEEYNGNDGVTKVRLDLFNAEFVTIDTIHRGEYLVPDFKPLQSKAQPSAGVVDMTAGFEPYNDEDNPF